MSIAQVSARPRATLPERYRLLIAGIMSLSQLIELEFVGTLYLHDILAPILLAYLLHRPGALGELKKIRMFFILAGIWLAGAILTDIYQQTAIADLARGWSRIVLLTMNVAMLWLLAEGRFRVYATYLAGCGFVLVFKTYFLPNEFTLIANDPWKAGIGVGLTFMVVALSAFGWRGYRFLNLPAAVILGAIGIFSLAMNFRALFAMALLSSAYAAFAMLVAARPELQRRISPAVFFGVILAGILAGQVLSTTYSVAAGSGALGDAARKKYISQTSGDVSLLLGGRPESLVSTQAIIDSPIIGHGSWAKDPYYHYLYYYKLREYGLPAPPNYYYFASKSDFLIPSHSHLLGSWVEAGILGTPLWIWALILAVQALYFMLRKRDVPYVLVALTAFAMLWDVLFSPFAAEARITKAVEFCILLATVTTARSLGRRAGAKPQRMRRVYQMNPSVRVKYPSAGSSARTARAGEPE